MSDPQFQPPRDGDDDSTIVRQIEAVLNLILPVTTHPGVAANVRLLEQHWAILWEDITS